MENVILFRDYTQASCVPQGAQAEDEINAKLASIQCCDSTEAETDQVGLPPLARFEVVLRQCDGLAKQAGGTLKAAVNHESSKASIELSLPPFSLQTREESDILIKFALFAENISFEATEDRSVRVCVTLPLSKPAGA